MSNYTKELKLDFDGPLPKYIGKRLRAIQHQFGISPVRTLYRRTKHGYHVRIELSRYIGYFAAYFFQLYLGSDRYRELKNFQRGSLGFKANILFEPSAKEKWRGLDLSVRKP